MKNIEITEENKDMYQEYIKANEKLLFDREFNDFEANKVIFEAFALAIILGFIGKILNIGMVIVMIPSIILSTAYPFIYQEYKYRKTRKKFQEKYPEFDMSLTEDDMQLAIKKYCIKTLQNRMLKETPTPSFNLTKYEKMDRIQAFEEMTNEEKIAYLKKEQEFWLEEKNKQNQDETSRTLKKEISV